MKVIIVGAGKLGRKLASTLTGSNIQVTVVDVSPKILEGVNDHLDVLSVQANGVELFKMKELDIASYDLMVAVTESDETNTIISTMGKRSGVTATVARIRNPEYLEQFEFIQKEMGIDYILNPDLAIADEVTRYLKEDYHMYSGAFADGKIQVVGYKADSLDGFIGKKIKEISGLKNMLIAALLKDEEVIIPNGDVVIDRNDILYFSGRSQDINNLAANAVVDIKKKQVKKIMIMGGGNVGYYVARKLSDANVMVTLVEQNWERCKYLTAKLQDVIVIHGDGSDMHLLEEENLAGMDVFFSATGMDETNILMSLTAKQAGVNKAIAKISRPNYATLIEKLGVDVALNQTNISASKILKFVHGDKVASIALMMDGNVELTEVIIDKESFVVDMTFADLKLPKDMIVTAINRGNEVLIPNGSTRIKAGDRLIILFLVGGNHKLDVFLKKKKGGIINEFKNRRKGLR